MHKDNSASASPVNLANASAMSAAMEQWGAPNSVKQTPIARSKAEQYAEEIVNVMSHWRIAATVFWKSANSAKVIVTVSRPSPFAASSAAAILVQSAATLSWRRARNASRTAIAQREKTARVVSAREISARKGKPAATTWHALWAEERAARCADSIPAAAPEATIVAQVTAIAPREHAAMRTPACVLLRHAACSVPPE